jgi:hypothetical protein
LSAGVTLKVLEVVLLDEVLTATAQLIVAVEPFLKAATARVPVAARFAFNGT